MKENNPRMTFSSYHVQQSLNESVVRADYLGLMTTFTVYDDEYYQFLHLSIQEFLAAWWIAKYEKTEKVFNDHFNDDHFRMCLRFVSGLTHLSVLTDQRVQIFTNTLTNNSQQNQCKILEVKLSSTTDDSVYKLLKLSFLQNIQECYCTLWNIPVDLCLVILQLLNLPLIKVLHLTHHLKLKDDSTNSILHTDKYSELETCIAMNSTLLEMNFLFKYNDNPIVSQTIISLINGVTGNKTITSFSLEVSDSRPLSDGTIEHLLKDNHTLQTLKLDIPHHVLPSSPNIVEVNTPLSRDSGDWITGVS